VFGTARESCPHTTQQTFGCWQVKKLGWPYGPADLPALFKWPSDNASVLMDVEEYRKSFHELRKYKIHINDSYSGMGTGGYALHLQHKHMVSDKLSSCIQTFRNAVMFDLTHISQSDVQSATHYVQQT
jgi:hypothetical protein